MRLLLLIQYNELGALRQAFARSLLEQAVLWC